MGLIDTIAPGAIALDTAIFVYFIEEHPTLLPLVEPIFRAADEGRRQVVTSALTLLEVLVIPYRAGNEAVARRYEALLRRGRGIRIADITREQLRSAAQLRATTGVKTPDALQLAAALTWNCATFVTNDRRLPAIPGLRIVQLESAADPR